MDDYTHALYCTYAVQYLKFEQEYFIAGFIPVIKVIQVLKVDVWFYGHKNHKKTVNIFQSHTILVVKILL